MSRGIAPVAVAASAVALVATSCGGGGSTGPNGAGSPIDFAGPVSLSGAYSTEGTYTLHGYQYCANTVNAKGGVNYGGQTHKLVIKTTDDQSKASNEAVLINQFNDQGIKFILSPYSSPLTAAAAPVVEKNGQIMVDSNGADTTIFHQGYQDTFGVLSPSTTYVTSMVDWLATLSPAPKTVAIISADDGFSQTAAAAGAKEAAAKGMSLVPAADSYTSSTKVKSNTTDVATALVALKPFSPDVILVSGHFNEAVAAIKQGTELGIRPKMGLGATVAVPNNDFGKLGSSVQGVFGSTQWVPQLSTSDSIFGTAQQFAQGYTSQFGDVVGGIPAYQAADAAAACEVMVKGIEAANSVDPIKVRNAMSKLNISTFYGRVQFDSASGPNPGLNTHKPMQVIQVQGEPTSPKLVTVYPANLATGDKAIWPAAS